MDSVVIWFWFLCLKHRFKNSCTPKFLLMILGHQLTQWWLKCIPFSSNSFCTNAFLLIKRQFSSTWPTWSSKISCHFEREHANVVISCYVFFLSGYRENGVRYNCQNSACVWQFYHPSSFNSQMYNESESSPCHKYSYYARLKKVLTYRRHATHTVISKIKCHWFR